MNRQAQETPLLDAFEHFQGQVHDLAMKMAHEIVRSELRRRMRRSKSRPRDVREGQATRADVSLPVALEGNAEVPATQPSAASETVRAWTRDAIINELASWLVSGTPIDAAFLRRHGSRGLVRATRREFGRFEAALNVAGLQVARLYPEKRQTPT